MEIIKESNIFEYLKAKDIWFMKESEKMKPHYFEQAEADTDDHHLGVAKMQGYIPPTCLLGGFTVMDEVTKGNSPCKGCKCDREKCKGKEYK